MDGHGKEAIQSKTTVFKKKKPLAEKMAAEKNFFFSTVKKISSANLGMERRRELEKKESNQQNCP